LFLLRDASAWFVGREEQSGEEHVGEDVKSIAEAECSHRNEHFSTKHVAILAVPLLNKNRHEYYMWLKKPGESRQYTERKSIDLKFVRSHSARRTDKFLTVPDEINAGGLSYFFACTLRMSPSKLCAQAQNDIMEIAKENAVNQEVFAVLYLPLLLTRTEKIACRRLFDYFSTFTCIFSFTVLYYLSIFYISFTNGLRSRRRIAKGRNHSQVLYPSAAATQSRRQHQASWNDGGMHRTTLLPQGLALRAWQVGV